MDRTLRDKAYKLMLLSEPKEAIIDRLMTSIDSFERMTRRTNGEAYDHSESVFTIGLDFDGTLVKRAGWPNIGAEIGARHWLEKLHELGAKFILVTMRDGVELQTAANVITEGWGIPLFGINHNPTQQWWTVSPKPHCTVYVDDRGLGINLIVPEEGHPYVDWEKAGPQLMGQFRYWQEQQESI